MNELDIFSAALDLTKPGDREHFLDDACRDRPELRQRIDHLLHNAACASQFLESAAPGVVATLDHTPAEQPGAQIGPYKLLEQIGEGGMGLVYMAEQQQPVRRLVALKLVKPGMDSKQVIARFEAERQALAMMDHPNIAKVHDAGTTETGRPFFVMELVRGIPINEFCDQQKLSVRQRLELFIQVCQAVQHAHQKGIIHRDLKPTNVLVTMNDVLAVPKVIDFGIAKALGQSLTDHTLHTGFAQLVGTPMYMSPEQAQMNQLGVDTRSDVYSLGVLLYELLTGTTPFDQERLKSVGFDEMRRIIREEEPETVSARIARTRSAERGARSEGNVPHSEFRAPRLSELDWIVMKALEKDRNRRYESASSFAADIQRYLSDEPVLAYPPTPMYRFQKFARKHQPALATATAIALCLLLGTTVSAWQAVRATTAETQANVNEQKANANAASAQAKEKEANTQRDEAKALADRLQRTLYAAHMNLAQRAWDDAAATRLEELLGQHRPKPGEADLRGFEWHYLQRLQRGGQLLALEGEYFESVAFSPDGKRILTNTSRWTGSSIGEPELQLWDAHSGKKLLTLKGDSSVVFSPDGSRLAAAVTTWDATQQNFVTPEFKVWDVESGRELFSCKGHTANVINSVAFSPDGKRLASASGDINGEAKIWDAQSGQKLLNLPGSTGDVRGVAFSPDGKRLAHGVFLGFGDGKHPGTVKVCDVQTGKELLSLTGGGGKVVYSPDGKLLASRNGGELSVWNAETGEELSSLKALSDDPIEFAFSPDGKRLAAAGQRWKMPSIKVFDTETGTEIFILYGHTSSINSLAFSPDSKFLASGSDDKTLRLWDLQAGQQIGRLQGHASGVFRVAYSPDGKRVASAPWLGDTVKIWDALNASEAISLHGRRTAISSDFTRLASTEADKSLKVWDANSRRITATLKGHTNEVLPMSFSPDGRLLATGEGHNPGEGPLSGPPVIKLWNVESGQTLHTLEGHVGPLLSVAFSPDGKLLASCSRAGGPGAPRDVKVWNVLSGQKLLSLQGPPGSSPWDNVTFSPDGKRLAAGGREVRVWDSMTGEVLVAIKGGGSRIAFSSDGKRIAGATMDEPVTIRDAQTGEELLTFNAGHPDYIESIAFSRDGNRLVTACREGLVKMWDTQTGQEILSMKAHNGGVESVSFTPDGHRLASASADGTVKIYDATPLPEKP